MNRLLAVAGGLAVTALTTLVALLVIRTIGPLQRAAGIAPPGWRQVG